MDIVLRERNGRCSSEDVDGFAICAREARYTDTDHLHNERARTTSNRAASRGQLGGFLRRLLRLFGTGNFWRLGRYHNFLRGSETDAGFSQKRQFSTVRISLAGVTDLVAEVMVNSRSTRKGGFFIFVSVR